MLCEHILSSCATTKVDLCATTMNTMYTYVCKERSFVCGFKNAII